MKKKVILIVVLAVVAAAAVYVGVRLARRGTDIIGVTTLSNKNTVIMNAKSDSDFIAGTGYLTVAAGEHIHLDCDLSAGSIDVTFRVSEDGGAASRAMDVDNLPTAEEMTGEGSFGQEGVSGKTSLDFEAAPAVYTVYIVNHGAVGRATVTTAK